MFYVKYFVLYNLHSSQTVLVINISYNHIGSRAYKGMYKSGNLKATKTVS